MKTINSQFWKGKRVFITGHTGFKGGWLSLWLQSMGSTVHGYALPPPTKPSLFEEAHVGAEMVSTIGDVRDYSALLSALKIAKPEIIFHMAAQPLVRLSYSQPIETYATNVMGTVHLLEAARELNLSKAIVNVTTDKCYENKEWLWGYRENERMGGHDPYSNSKGCSELVTSAYRSSYFSSGGIAVATARAGNVIGGGDWAIDRLIPDILRAFEKNEAALIRNPQAIRPWQHVLEPLSGYLALAEQLFVNGQAYAEAWNFGPGENDAKPVQWIVEKMAKEWGGHATWHADNSEHPHEASYLKLDISKAKSRLQWHPRWDLARALEGISAWHRAWLNKENMNTVCLNQIDDFMRAD
ncbi:CDP-glucose 4,6-dehydratase [Polynucleobacter sp. AP-Elch-400A-B2]|uniref:CDP-glucose 4,6-dehydratase n=1 Tax=Polynucleobacter sp. AP-Elch-400A-B2 TaxID=2576930 RepID=UPI001BFDBFF4|nr:CDP-glucose 4,6-dehydratase [Polynucleobacter sp. AP-Elch-400A-B2]QWE24978.1 CDP-glucose 4,6-dehydratase [Polynucleobacter sp. AP-Elch-400A-B2]